MQLLIPVWDTFFWHQSLHKSIARPRCRAVTRHNTIASILVYINDCYFNFRYDCQPAINYAPTCVYHEKIVESSSGNFFLHIKWMRTAQRAITISKGYFPSGCGIYQWRAREWCRIQAIVIVSRLKGETRLPEAWGWGFIDIVYHAYMYAWNIMVTISLSWEHRHFTRLMGEIYWSWHGCTYRRASHSGG